MKMRWLLAILLVPGLAWSATESSWPMKEMHPDLTDVPSLQNGMRLYVNFCLGCHSLKFQRYERTVDDLQIPHDVALQNLVFTGQKIGEQMRTSMDPELAKAWFGAPPPDLTMVTRVRGPEWVYNYLLTFYVDESRPLGVNNKVFENVAMPHVLLPLQGVQRIGCRQVAKRGENGRLIRDPLAPGQVVAEQKCDQLVVDQGTGLLTDVEYDQAVFDITNFLHYVSDPSRLDRHRIGAFVLLFLAVLWVFTWLLGREYNKAVR
jgi:cytochrome c1